MCIIVSKEKGVELPSKNTFKTCFTHNSDGAGIMYVSHNKVMIEKGFMCFEDFWRRIKELKKQFGDLTYKSFVFHFRIGTSGGIVPERTHPFPLTNNIDLINALDLVTNIGVAHNGILTEFTDLTKPNSSDTQNFIIKYLYPLYKLNPDFLKHEDIIEMIEQSVGTYNKFCILDSDENIYYINKSCFLSDNGVLYSNSTYKPYEYKSFSNLPVYNDYYEKYDGYDDYDYNYKTTEVALDEIKDDIVVDTNNNKYFRIEKGFITYWGVTEEVKEYSNYYRDTKGCLYELYADNDTLKLDFLAGYYKYKKE